MYTHMQAVGLVGLSAALLGWLAGCVRGVHKTASFDSDVHTEAHASTLGQAWCHRMQYFKTFASIMMMTGIQAERESYCEQADFVALVGSDVGSRIKKGIGDIRKIFAQIK